MVVDDELKIIKMINIIRMINIIGMMEEATDCWIEARTPHYWTARQELCKDLLKRETFELYECNRLLRSYPLPTG